MKIVFVGNCQAAALRTMFDLYVRPHTDDVTEFIIGTTPLTPDGQSSIEGADLVVEQVFDVPQWVDVSQLSVSGHICRVPVVGAPFIWPFAGAEHPLSYKLYGDYHPFRSEIGDGYLNKLMSQGLSPEFAAERYLSEDMALVGKLDRLREITMDRQRMRDIATGYRCADFIEENFQREQLFLTPYHLSTNMARYLALTFLESISAPTKCIESVRRYMVSSFYPPYATPVHPSIAAHFGLRWADSHTRYPFHFEGAITFHEFVYRYVRCEANLDLHRAIVAADSGDTESGALLAAALEKCPGSSRGWVALAHLRMRSREYEAAIPLLKQAMALEPNAEWAHHLLSQCLFQAGDVAGAEKELSVAVTHRPYEHGMRAYLAHLQARRCAWAEAIASITGALEFAPKNVAYNEQLESYTASERRETNSKC